MTIGDHAQKLRIVSNSTPSVHHMAYVHPDAQIGTNVRIEPFATIQGDVVIGDNCRIGSNAVIMDGTRMGNNCQVYPGAVVGAAPQDLKYQGEPTTLEIGHNVVIREFCTLNKGTAANQRTVIGDNCLLMAYVHVAHDCVVGKNVVLANNTTLAGHIEVEDYARLGGLVAVQQFVRIGTHSFIGGGSMVRKDIPPFIKAARNPVSYVGVNSIGLQRVGYSAEQIHTIQDTYRILYISKYNTTQALKAIRDQVQPAAERDQILTFVESSQHGVIRGFRHLNGQR